jgi:hypothetical protein
VGHTGAVAVAAFVVPLVERLELADLFSCESSPLSGGSWVPVVTCTFFDLDRYDHGVEGLDWLLLAPVGSGASMCASSDSVQY